MSIRREVRLSCVVGCVVGLSGLGACGPDEAPLERVQGALSSCVTLPAAGDATLSRAQMRKSFGAQKVLRVGDGDESLVRFDLSSIPAAAAIDSAALSLYVSDADTHRPVNVHRATADWSEGSVTFASFAQRFASDAVGSIALRCENVSRSVDLTAVVRGWVSRARPNYGLLLDGCGDGVTFVSREGGRAAQRPALRVCYSLPEDHCAAKPCQHGGACENDRAGFTCRCAPGWTGPTCAGNVDDCAANPCQHGGACADGLGSYTCTCAPGFTGASCEVDVDDCAPSPCANGGVCEDGVAAAICHCPPGYAGPTCAELVDGCAASPCQHGGTCANGAGRYTCTCPAGFAGLDCEIDVDDCAAQPCHNGGTCVDGVDSFSCACPPDRGGPTCDVDLDTCGQGPCLNGATCTNVPDAYVCGCQPGYAGPNCEIDVDDCGAHPCLNGGVCVDGVNAYSCSCPREFVGARCEAPAPRWPPFDPAKQAPVEMTPLGTAAPGADGGAALVTPASPAAGAGAVWTAAPVRWTDGLRTTFELTMAAGASGGSPEGLAIVLARAPGVGGPAGGLGYAGLGPSLAVELDVNRDVALGDPAVEHVAVHTRGALDNSASEMAAAYALATTFPYDPNGGPRLLSFLDDAWAQPVRVALELEAGASTTTLRVYLDVARQDYWPSLLLTAELPNTLLLDALGSDWAYLGLTTTVGPAPSTVAVGHWTVDGDAP